jgi:hypothetical protein
MSFRDAIFSVLGANQLTSQMLLTAYRYKHRREFPRRSFSDSTLATVRSAGYCIIENFMPRSFCMDCMGEVERSFAQYPSVVHQPRVEQADTRIFGVEKVSPLCAAFADDPRLQGFVAGYTDNAALMFTLANIIDIPNEFGSGGMWHRDGFLPELKCILYLNDVNADNGPFRLIADSHAMGRYHRRDMRRYGMTFMQNRIGTVADRLIEREPERMITATGPAGTLVLFDTSVIHTGAPLKSGKRVALTNYYTDQRNITEALRDHYSPLVLGPDSYYAGGETRSLIAAGSMSRSAQ